jgi:hypothetical protein
MVMLKYCFMFASSSTGVSVVDFFYHVMELMLITTHGMMKRMFNFVFVSSFLVLGFNEIFNV